MKNNKSTQLFQYVAQTFTGLVVFIFVPLILAPAPLYALRNPATVYCKALGYNYISESTPGGIRGFCILEDGQVVGDWDFFLGKVAQEQSYCARMGYDIITLSHNKKCIKYMTDECAFCILPDGSKEEVSNLMGLSFQETTCGDATCGMPENHSTCPDDCPSGGWDAYCDEVKDGIIDPDCDKFVDPDEMLIVSTKITPQALNCASKDSWIKAHMILPADIPANQVDKETPAVIENFAIPSETLKVSPNDAGELQVDASFSRDALCSALESLGGDSIELNVSARLINGEYVFGLDTIKFKY
jgi:putative hemolysin